MTDIPSTEQPKETIGTMFGRGLVVLIPVVFTIWILYILFSWIDGFALPLFELAMGGRYIPGLGFISMIILIFIVGALAKNLVGRTIVASFDRIISTVPLARTIYSSMKDLINAFQPGGKTFRQVVLIEFPRKGVNTIGFVTNEISLKGMTAASSLVSIYIPNPPNPTAGMLVFVPRGDVYVLDMTVEEGLKLVLSGGIVTSGTLTIK